MQHYLQISIFHGESFKISSENFCLHFSFQSSYVFRCFDFCSLSSFGDFCFLIVKYFSCCLWQVSVEICCGNLMLNVSYSFLLGSVISIWIEIRFFLYHCSIFDCRILDHQRNLPYHWNNLLYHQMIHLDLALFPLRSCYHLLNQDIISRNVLLTHIQSILLVYLHRHYCLPLSATQDEPQQSQAFDLKYFSLPFPQQHLQPDPYFHRQQKRKQRYPQAQ